MTEPYRFLDVETRDGVTFATMNGPDELNRWAGDTEWEVLDLARRVGSDSAVHALVLTGAGEHFTAGLAPAVGVFDPFAFYERARTLVATYINLDKPVIMALNGTTFGSGLTFALTGDIIIAERHITFVDAHVVSGIVSATGPYLWPRSTGLLNAKRYLLTGEPFDAATAKDIGLVTKVVDTGQALARATEFAARFAAMPVAGVAGTKRALNQWMRRTSSEIFDHALALEFLGFPIETYEAMTATHGDAATK